MNDNAAIRLSGWLTNTPLGYCLWFRDGGGVLLNNWQLDSGLVDHPVTASGWWTGDKFRAEQIEVDTASAILWNSRPSRYRGDSQ